MELKSKVEAIGVLKKVGFTLDSAKELIEAVMELGVRDHEADLMVKGKLKQLAG